MEHDLIASACRDHLPVAPPKRPIGPPSILDQPRFPDRINGAAVDEQRAAVIAGSHRDATRNRKATRTAHIGPSLPLERSQHRATLGKARAGIDFEHPQGSVGSGRCASLPYRLP